MRSHLILFAQGAVTVLLLSHNIGAEPADKPTVKPIVGGITRNYEPIETLRADFTIESVTDAKSVPSPEKQKPEIPANTKGERAQAGARKKNVDNTEVGYATSDPGKLTSDGTNYVFTLKGTIAIAPGRERYEMSAGDIGNIAVIKDGIRFNYVTGSKWVDRTLPSSAKSDLQLDPRDAGMYSADQRIIPLLTKNKLLSIEQLPRSNPTPLTRVSVRKGLSQTITFECDPEMNDVPTKVTWHDDKLGRLTEAQVEYQKFSVNGKPVWVAKTIRQKNGRGSQTNTTRIEIKAINEPLPESVFELAPPGTEINNRVPKIVDEELKQRKSASAN